ncbi:MAG: hypothetical protein ABIO21_22205 [Pseudomonas sp.]
MPRLTPDPLSADAFRRCYGDILHDLRKPMDNPSDTTNMTRWRVPSACNAWNISTVFSPNSRRAAEKPLCCTALKA